MEEVLVEPVGPNRFRLLRSPGLVLGVAADDVFELLPQGRLKVLERGSNICVQVYVPPSHIDEIEERLLSITRDVGARLDGKSSKQLVLTIRWRNNFELIEELLSRIVGEYSGVKWFYGNVYDPEDGTTPLGWWNESSER